jgi:hypothetical protein
METVIKINLSELNASLLDKIRNLISGNDDAEITISVQDTPSKKYLRNETREEYFARLNKSIEQLKKGNVISFTPEALEEYSRNTLNEL